MIILISIIAAIMLLVLTFKYPIISTVFFLTSSLIKANLVLRFQIFQRFDLTVLAACYVLFAMIITFLRRPWDIRKLFNGPYFMMLLLACILFLGLTYTSAPNYGWQKSSRYFAFGSIMFFAPIIFVAVKSDITKVLWLLIIIGVAVSAVTIAMPQGDIQERTGGRAGFLEAGPLETAEKAAVGGIIAFCFLIFKNNKQIVKIISAILIPLTLLAVFLTGSRGSLFAMVLCFAMTPFLLGRRISVKWLIPAVIIIVVGTGYTFAIAGRVAERAVERIALLWTSGEGVKGVAGSRLPLYSWTLARIPNSPIIGHGTGAYAVDSGQGDERHYPHNAILELGYENGLIGVTMFIVFTYLIYSKWKYARKCIKTILDDEELFLSSSVAGILFIFVFLQVMKSNDLDGNRFMFFCAGLIMSVFYVVTETLQQIEEESLYDNLNQEVLYTEM